MQELGTKDENSLHGGLVVTVLVKFLYLFAASMLLGLAFGLGTSFLMKRAKSNSVPQVHRPTRTPHIPPFSSAEIGWRCYAGFCQETDATHSCASSTDLGH